MFILTYVDDMIVTGTNETEIQSLIEQLKQHFSIKDLGDLHYFLGIEFKHTISGMFLSQIKYIQDLLSKAGMQGAKSSTTPMVGNPPLSKFNGQPIADASLYRSIVGGFHYVTITRPEISYIVNKVSQFMQFPLDTHWKAVKRILWYLVGNVHLGLHFIQSDSLIVTAFCDADWGSDLDDRRSTSGFCVFMGKNLVSWSSKKQALVSRSSTEAKYRSLAYTVCDLIWLLSLFKELHIPHMPSLDQAADIFTKPLSGQFFIRMRNKLHIIPDPTSN
ncbi:hypothetical protein DH2020_021412 [Rehmannia glutinosa]|uniref:Reverse transcriptase Ty1/copia-type domain-containing protein n=1 Tax=Rehmannia glutinosa TaxID=99300 RepID=A0ABR0WB09_REHGL